MSPLFQCFITPPPTFSDCYIYTATYEMMSYLNNECLVFRENALQFIPTSHPSITRSKTHFPLT